MENVAGKRRKEEVHGHELNGTRRWALLSARNCTAIKLRCTQPPKAISGDWKSSLRRPAFQLFAALCAFLSVPHLPLVRPPRQVKHVIVKIVLVSFCIPLSIGYEDSLSINIRVGESTMCRTHLTCITNGAFYCFPLPFSGQAYSLRLPARSRKMHILET